MKITPRFLPVQAMLLTTDIVAEKGAYLLIDAKDQMITVSSQTFKEVYVVDRGSSSASPAKKKRSSITRAKPGEPTKQEQILMCFDSGNGPPLTLNRIQIAKQLKWNVEMVSPRLADLVNLKLLQKHMRKSFTSAGEYSLTEAGFKKVIELKNKQK